MRIRCVPALLLLPALLLAGCAAGTDTPPVAARAVQGVDCPACFTIIEYMRGSPREQAPDRVEVRCELCCELLTFTTTADGQLLVSTTAHPEPMPCDVCAPAR